VNLFEKIYYKGYRYRTDRDLKEMKTLPLPVISVGNITTGGTGKTPAVIAIASEAKKRGLSPCVLTRGYRGRLRGPVFVSEENYASDMGDEPLLIASRLHDVPVVKCPDRYEGGMFALENLEDSPGLFILDDGFQHRRLRRDMDVVLINALDPFGGRRLLPFGRLREPLEELSRSGCIVITKASGTDDGMIEALTADIRKYNFDAPVHVSSHMSSHVMIGVSHHEKAVDVDAGMEPIEWLKGRKVFAFCAIAGPESFMRSLKEAGAIITGSKAFRDHHVFRHSDLKSITELARESGADWIMTTEKDIMRLRALKETPVNCASLGIEFHVDKGFFDYIFRLPG